MINTIEELEALPTGSVIQPRNGWVLVKDSTGWWGDNNASWTDSVVAAHFTPATLLIPATITREKLSELVGALNCDYWDVVEIVEEVLHGLGIEVSDG